MTDRSEQSRAAVIGAGTMGNGIAHVFAQHGFRVVLTDVSGEVLERALAAIRTSMQRQIKRGTLDEAGRDAALARIETATDLSAVAGAEIVVEAVPEVVDLKIETLKALDEVTLPTAILATNTSSISITRLAAQTDRPDRVVGMHFMNPVPVMELVEVIRGLATSDGTVDQVTQLARDLGKTPVVVKDSPGFVSNRVLAPMLNEAVYCLYEGIATPEAIDQVMKLGMNHPIGPLALADLIGLDTCLSVLEVLHRDLGDDKYRPCPLLKQYVAAGWLGRKTARGFYVYE